MKLQSVGVHHAIVWPEGTNVPAAVAAQFSHTFFCGLLLLKSAVHEAFALANHVVQAHCTTFNNMDNQYIPPSLPSLYSPIKAILPDNSSIPGPNLAGVDTSLGLASAVPGALSSCAGVCRPAQARHASVGVDLQARAQQRARHVQRRVRLPAPLRTPLMRCARHCRRLVRHPAAGAARRAAAAAHRHVRAHRLVKAQLPWRGRARAASAGDAGAQGGWVNEPRAGAHAARAGAHAARTCRAPRQQPPSPPPLPRCRLRTQLVGSTPCPKTPANLPAGCTALRCELRTTSGAEVVAILGGQPSVLQVRGPRWPDVARPQLAALPPPGGFAGANSPVGPWEGSPAPEAHAAAPHAAPRPRARTGIRAGGARAAHDARGGLAQPAVPATRAWALAAHAAQQRRHRGGGARGGCGGAHERVGGVGAAQLEPGAWGRACMGVGAGAPRRAPLPRPSPARPPAALRCTPRAAGSRAACRTLRAAVQAQYKPLITLGIAAVGGTASAGVSALDAQRLKVLISGNGPAVHQLTDIMVPGAVPKVDTGAGEQPLAAGAWRAGGRAVCTRAAQRAAPPNCCCCTRLCPQGSELLYVEPQAVSACMRGACTL